MPTISRTYTEETDYIVAQQCLIGFMNNLTVPLLIGLIVFKMANRDQNTNISQDETNTIASLHNVFYWMQWLQFISAYMFVFVSAFKGPKWWPKGKFDYLYVMPKIFFAVFMLGDLLIIPLTEWILLLIFRKEISNSGFANYFHLCGLFQFVFVLLVRIQL